MSHLIIAVAVLTLICFAAVAGAGFEHCRAGGARDLAGQLDAARDQCARLGGLLRREERRSAELQLGLRLARDATDAHWQRADRAETRLRSVLSERAPATTSGSIR